MSDRQRERVNEMLEHTMKAVEKAMAMTLDPYIIAELASSMVALYKCMVEIKE